MGGAAAKREIFSNHCGFKDSLTLVCCEVAIAESRVVVEGTQQAPRRTSTAKEEFEESKIETEPTSTTHNVISTDALPRPKISRSTISTIRFKDTRTTTTTTTATTTRTTTTTTTTTITTTTTTIIKTTTKTTTTTRTTISRTTAKTNTATDSVPIKDVGDGFP